MIKPDLLSTLEYILKRKNLTLLNDAIIPVISLLKEPGFLKALEPHEALHDPHINQFYYKDKYYNIFIDNIIVDGIRKYLDPIKEEFKSKPTTSLMHILENIHLIVSQTTNRKNNAFLKTFLDDPNSKRFLHDYLCNTIKLGYKDNYTFKVTRFSINLANNMLFFIIAQKRLLHNLMKLFDLLDSINVPEKDIPLIIKFINGIFTNDEVSKHEIFADMGIKDKNIQEYISIFFRDKLYINGSQNTIYNETIKQLMLSHIENIDRATMLNLLNKTYVNLGYSFLDLLISSGAMKIEEFWDETKKRTIKILTLTDEIDKAVFFSQTEIKPLLTEHSLYNSEIDQTPYKKGVYNLVHPNHRININLNDDTYLRKEPMYARLSIKVDCLINFLRELDGELNEQKVCSLYDVSYSKYCKLKEIGHYIKPALEIIIANGGKLHITYTSNQIKKHIKNDIFNPMKAKMQELNDTPNLLILQETYDQYNDIIESICDKVCQRKTLLVNCLKECIGFSLYKYFIVRAFIDTRGRKYLEGLSFNINNNPYAKIIIGIVKPNYNFEPKLEELEIIKNCLRFEQIKNKIQLSPKSNRNLNRQLIHKYILSYINIKNNEFQSWIEKPAYFDNYKLIIERITQVLKKPKNLYYVHSLVYFEQLHFRNLHNKHIINTVQVDASSSGTQMMSILLKNENLGKISNLIGTENYDIYEKARNYNYTTYMKIYEFVNTQLKIHNCHHFFLKNQMNLNYNVYYAEDYKALPRDGHYDIHLLTLFINMDIFKSSILKVVLTDLIKMIQSQNIAFDKNITSLIINYLPGSVQEMLNNLSCLLEFKNNKNELMYLFSLRLAIRLVNIVENHICISHNTNHKDSLWFSRDLTKDHVMTLMYMSTAYGRKNGYIYLIQDKYILGKKNIHLLKEFSNFLEVTTTSFIKQETSYNLITDFLSKLDFNKKCVIVNKYFTITLDPKKFKDVQISCSSYLNKRGPQLVIKNYLSELDTHKLNSMFMANLAHSMDSAIMHIFSQKLIQINKELIKNNHNFKLIAETNHDCFTLNYPCLLPILVEEAYLTLINENYIDSIQGLSKEIKDKYAPKSKEEFLALLNPINPYFMK